MSRTRLGALLLALAAVVSGCTGLPESGPVVDVPGQSTVDDERPSDINAVPPTAGMTPSAVVAGFLDAMSASPTRIDVAEQFLTTTAAGEWEPAAGTVVYTSRDQLREFRSQVTVGLFEAERLDQSGAYLGRLTGTEGMVQFDLALEGGEYRITNPPDALVVPRVWFDQRYRQASLYYFDPSGRILVPQPVYVPRGESFLSSLVARLLAEPGPDLGRVVRSYLPPGLDPRVAVTVSDGGVVDVDLGGEATVNGAAADRLLAQLAWTLRQQSDVRELRVTLGGSLVRGPDGDDLYAVDEADAFDPNGPDPSTELYAVRDRMLQVRDGNGLRPVPGPFGSGRSQVRAATPNIDATRAAGVGLQGRSLLVADLVDAAAPADPVDPADPADPADPTGTADPADPADPSGPGAEEAPADFVFRGTDLLPPAWDFSDRVWVVDRTTTGASVHVVDEGRDRVVEISGVSGQDVRSFLVSRDGTRFVAVVRGPDQDEVRVGRIEADAVGAVVRVRSTQSLDLDLDLARPYRITDIAWTSPTTIALLTPLRGDDFFEVRTIGVDGSPSLGDSPVTPVPGPVIELAGTPVAGAATYAVRPDNFIDLTDGQSFGIVGGPPTSLVYAG